MTTIEFNSSHLRRLGRPRRVLAALKTALVRRAAEQAARRALHALDDKMLADTGIGRSQIKHAVRHGRPGEAAGPYLPATSSWRNLP